MTGLKTLQGLLILLTLCASARAESPLATFTLRDDLKREWHNELVFLTVDEQVFGQANVTLLGPAQATVPHQWVPAELAPAGKPSIALLATVPELGDATYRLIRGTPAKQSDLTARQNADTISLSNHRIGITLGGPRASTQGPIAGLRLPSGQTVTSGQLHTTVAPTSVKAALLAAGPVFAEATVDYTFPDYRFWRLRFRVIAGEPVVLVDEQFNLPSGAKYTLRLANRWNADQLFYRDNGNRCRTVATNAVKIEPVFSVAPWPFWWGEELRANWVTVFGRSATDSLTLAAREPGLWVTPDRTDWDTAVTLDRDLAATFQLQGFQRKWMLIGLTRAESIREDELGQAVVPLQQKQLIRHGDFPLDRVKDYTLTWDDRHTSHPRLFTTKGELERFRKRFQVDQSQLDKLRKTNVFGYSMDAHVAYFLATRDEQLGRKLADFALAQLQQSVDGFVRQQQLRNPGSCPHHRNRGVYWGAIAADLALSSDVLTAEERARIKAQLAFLGYTLSRPLVISPQRGYNANPNMTTMARGMLGIVACTIPRHPHAGRWAETAIAEMQQELEQWCGGGGGWLEAPHYATASLDTLISLALAVRGTGFSEVEWEFHPQLRAAVAWLAKISTPPDPRLNDSRHMPAIGNSYLGEPTCLPGWMATIWRDKDPAFARRMQWMWKAQGMPRSPGIGGAYPGLQGYNHLFLDDGGPDAKPPYGSELFPEAGAVLRAHFPGGQETYLHYIQGKMHQHYDFDEGSFILWGKGRPLCEDFGYYGRAPAADHSRIDDGFYEALGVEGKIQEFAAGESVDYLRGERHGWHRQILFVKDRDPLGPNYFLIRDAVVSGRDFDWRAWIATDERPAAEGNPVRAKGRFGVDLAVFFLTPTGKVTGEEITRTAGTAGWGHDRRTTSQHSLELKQVAADQPVCVVLYPLMADQPTPKFTALADGRAVKIVHSFGTDYAMLGLQRFRFEQENIVFDGKAAAIQVRRDGTRLSLPRRGTVSYRGQSLEARTEPARSVTRVFQ